MVLRTIEKDPTAQLTGAALPPDGTSFAISMGSEAEIHIRLLSLSGGSDRELTVKGWPNLTGLDWSPDGKGLFVGSVSPQARTLLYVDLKGDARVLWQFDRFSSIVPARRVQGIFRLHLGRTVTGRPLPRYTRRRHQQQRLDAGRVPRRVTSDR